MKILLTTAALVMMQVFTASAQKINDDKKEIAVSIIKQKGSLEFDCGSKAGVFNNGYELERDVRGGADCVNPADLLKVDFEKQTLIGYQVSGDCFVRGRAEVFRNDEMKTFRVQIYKKSGGCRAGGWFQGWVVVDKIPKDYKVEFSETKIADREKDFESELLEDELILPETVETRAYDMKYCARLFRGDSVIRTPTEFLAAVRNDASRKTCTEQLEKIDFKKETLVGASFVTGYCYDPPGLKTRITRDDRRKFYVVFIIYDDPFGRTCRALKFHDLRLAVPKIPDDYTVKFEVASVLNTKYSN